jgi:protein tyrosine phosphatase
MAQEIIIKVVNYLIPVILGYCISVINNHKKKQTATNQALKIMLQNNLTNTYFVYSTKKKIPDYVYKNWLNMLDEYENLDGDDYIHALANKMEDWDIVRTDILEVKE